MKGKYEIQIENNFLCYKFCISRNITVIQGYSATGKTVLIQLISDIANNGSLVSCKISPNTVNLQVISPNDDLWDYRIQVAHNTIFFLDEDCDFVKSHKFTQSVKQSDSYFVIVSRNRLSMLSYSLEEVYEITEDKKYPKLKKTYNTFIRKYNDNQRKIVPTVILTEDSNSGYQFMCKAFSQSIIPCNGKDNVAKTIHSTKNNSIIAIVDGAAFGPEIEDVMLEMKIRDLQGKQTVVFAPESF